MVDPLKYWALIVEINVMHHELAYSAWGGGGLLIG